ncbi:hypothetical protein QR680_012433 [Steinernema hermaphroditum]|uniref:Uncharacterized protein n=1 Tax=Steinernema hermaphroditum TaxID=289476 RepID=A0AA39I207_9BILA|nr:hypothetical protein QR680_012433 [Steinernema hermaphroditum]
MGPFPTVHECTTAKPSACFPGVFGTLRSGRTPSGNWLAAPLVVTPQTPKSVFETSAPLCIFVYSLLARGGKRSSGGRSSPEVVVLDAI